MGMQPKLIDIEQITDGWVKKYVLTYELPDGSIHRNDSASRKSLEDYRALLERNGAVSAACVQSMQDSCASEDASGTDAVSSEPADAVGIVAVTPHDSLVMIREFRYPLNSWCIAFPAGLIESGEDPATSAARELEEETGYALVPGTSPRLLPQPGYSSTGMTDETVQVVFMEAERIGDAHLEESELIEVFELPIADVPHFLETNQLPIGSRAQLVLEMFRDRQMR